METLDRLIYILCAEKNAEPPQRMTREQKENFFRALCNIRPPLPVSEEFLRLQDEYLSAKTKERGTVHVKDLKFSGGTTVWQGDITRLDADASVNAGNSALLGCFEPLHSCIDNIIHSNAGVQVRLDCNDIMRGGSEANGKVKVTKAYNLPSKFIFHTVGPIVSGAVTAENRRDRKNCYLSSLEKAAEMELDTIAFCCLSTGVFRFPKDEACRIAVSTVREWKKQNVPATGVIFDVFLDEDRDIYEKELS